MALFEGYERREAKILATLKEYGINSIEECRDICLEKGVDCDKIVRGTQPICFENAVWAYTVGAAIAIKKGCTKAADAAAAIGIGLQSFCIPGSVAENRKVGLGHGNLGAMLLHEDTDCFCFLAGHESFAAAEGAIKIAENANKVRVKPLRVILNGLGKDAAYIISRINGFTYCRTQFDPYTETVKVTDSVAFSEGSRAKVKCYGADSVPEGVAIMQLENVSVSITGNNYGSILLQADNFSISGLNSDHIFPLCDLPLHLCRIRVVQQCASDRTVFSQHRHASPVKYKIPDSFLFLQESHV